MADHKIKITVEGEDKASKPLSKAGDALDKFGKGAKDVGSKLTLGITAPLAGLVALAIKASTDLNAAMANVASLGVPTERVVELKTAVQDLSIAVGKDTGDLADGLYQVVSAFGDTADTVKILEINAKAGAAGLATTTDAINLTSAVTKGWGDTSAAAVQKASDLAFVAVQLGQTTFPELAGSVGKVVPLMQSLGGSQEELFAVMATATGVTGNAAEVSTQLRGVLQSLMAPTGNMVDLMGDLGYANGEAMLKALGMKGTIDAIVQAANASGTPLAKYIGSVEGQTLALALSGAQSDNYVTKLAAMNEAAGATDTAFAAQTEGINKFGFALAQARQKGQVFLQRFGDALVPVLMEAVDAIAPLGDKIVNLATAFTRLSPATRKWIVIIGGAAAALGPALVLLSTISGSLSSLLSLAGTIGAAFSLMLGPITLVAGALAALWAIDFGGMRTKIGAFVSNFIENIDRLPLIAQDVFNAISWIWQGPKQASNIDWWWDITHNIETLLGLDFGALDGLADKLYDTGIVAGGVVDVFKKLADGGAGMAKAISDDIVAIGQVTGAKIDVTAGVTTVDWGTWTYKYDAAAGITRVDWVTPGLGTFKYDSTTGIASIDWTGSLGDYQRQAFSYDSSAGIKRVIWNEDMFTFDYDALAHVTKVDFVQGLFKGTYTAIANISNVFWGVYQHFYSSQATIIRVAWGAYEHLYNAQTQITQDGVLWGLWSNTYNARAQIAESSILWGAGTFTYDVSAKVSEGSVFWGVYQHFYSASADIVRVAWGAYDHLYDATAGIKQDSVLWGAWSNTYDVLARVGESSVLWGVWTFDYDVGARVQESRLLWGAFSNTYDVNARVGKTGVLWGLWTWEYSATAGVQNITFANGLDKTVGDWFKWAIENAAIASANITVPEWVTGLLAWSWPELFAAPDWLTTLTAWDWPKLFSAPGWVTTLTSWEWPSFSEPGWLKNLLNWKWPSLPQLPSWLGGGGGDTATNATGDPYWRGGTTWVGEKGPELVTLPRGSRIFNHERSMAMAGTGDTYNVTFAPVVNGEIDLQAALDQLLRKLERRRP